MTAAMALVASCAVLVCWLIIRPAARREGEQSANRQSDPARREDG
jgi:hypothetical protein